MHILSIQSWVVSGHVGNAAAMFPLQRLGAEVSAIHTVQFSNHPGHGGYTGQAFPPEHIRSLIDGMAARGALAGCEAVLSGYVGDPGTGEAILHAVARTRAVNPRALYACDPVIGDAGAEYVRPGVAPFFRDRAVAEADILTPNQFELGVLTGMPCGTLGEARGAARELRSRMRPAGPRLVCVTSFDAAGEFSVLAVGEGCHRVRVPLLPREFRGAGDAMAALLLFHFLSSGDLAQAASRAASGLHGVLRRTLEAGSPELCLVAAQEELVHPSRRFDAEAWGGKDFAGPVDLPDPGSSF